MKQYTSARSIVEALQCCISALSFHHDVCFLLHMPVDETLLLLLSQQKVHYERIAQSAQEENIPTEKVNELSIYCELAERLKATWKTDAGAVKVLCSDHELTDLAAEARRRGSLILRKDEIKKHIDFTPSLPFWSKVPNYTLVFLGGIFALSSPEYDLFRSMCWLYDEAVKTDHELQQHEKRFGANEFNEHEYLSVRGVHRIMCVQTVINAFLVLEAYLNSLAHLHLTDDSRTLSDEVKLFLQEQTKDGNGNLRQKFVSIEDKLHEWIRIISPRGETFDKGGRLGRVSSCVSKRDQVPFEVAGMMR